MAQELQVTNTLQVAKGFAAESLSLSGRFTLNGTNFVKRTQVIPTTAGGTALHVEGLSTPLGMYMILNKDATNYVDIMDAVSGNVIARIKAGEGIQSRFPATATAPAALANTASVEIEFLICED